MRKTHLLILISVLLVSGCTNTGSITKRFCSPEWVNVKENIEYADYSDSITHDCRYDEETRSYDCFVTATNRLPVRACLGIIEVKAFGMIPVCDVCEEFPDAHPRTLKLNCYVGGVSGKKYTKSVWPEFDDCFIGNPSDESVIEFCGTLCEKEYFVESFKLEQEEGRTYCYCDKNDCSG